MHKISFILFLFLFQSSFAQNSKDISIFNRLVITNSQNELLMVKVKGTDFWVTPGLYQSSEQTTKEGLDSLAATYGLEIQKLKLRGTFILKRDINGSRSTSWRNVYVAIVNEIEIKLPEGIETIEWLLPEQALDKMTFPHISAMLEPIMAEANELWAGTLLQYKERDQWARQILEEFYKL